MLPPLLTTTDKERYPLYWQQKTQQVQALLSCGIALGAVAHSDTSHSLIAKLSEPTQKLIYKAIAEIHQLQQDTLPQGALSQSTLQQGAFPQSMRPQESLRPETAAANEATVTSAKPDTQAPKTSTNTLRLQKLIQDLVDLQQSEEAAATQTASDVWWLQPEIAQSPLLKDWAQLTPELFSSPPEHYRMRAEFAIYHQDEERIDYAMFEPGSKPRKMILIQDFPGCTKAINEAMAWLREHLGAYPELKHKLFEVDFLCNTAGNVVITLHYHKKLADTWQEAAADLLRRHAPSAPPAKLPIPTASTKLDQIKTQSTASSIESSQDAPHATAAELTPYRYSLVAHARKQTFKVGPDFVVETIPTNAGLIYLKQVEGTFSQPNANACKDMLNFALSAATLGYVPGTDAASAEASASTAASATATAAATARADDLIELYCGSGTFTVALAPYFRKVFATELARVPTATAVYNMKLNQRSNIKLARLSALEVTQAINQEREFHRLAEQEINLADYDFRTTLIDPPRAGLHDQAALAFTQQFDRIIYISCGPAALAADLAVLTQTHAIKKIAFFDQFPYTHHLESGIFLERRS